VGVEDVELDENAPAFVVAGGGDVGLILAHGGGEGDGRRYFVGEAKELAALGATVVVPVCGIPLVGDLARDEAAIERVVALQRRALDLLVARGATRLGFFGHSAGGLQGAVLAATEPRLQAIAIAAIGTGLARRAPEWFEQLSPSRDEYVAGIERWEAAHLLSRPGKRRLLVQAARFDDNIPLEAVREMYESAAEPKEWGEYDCDHGAVVVDPAARADRLDFFRRALAWA
jgi:pimeloyl-ACP methyl ester carboxylesterase